MKEKDELEVFAEKTFRLIVRIPQMELEAVENAVRETAEIESFDEVDVSNFSANASHAEFEGEFNGNPIKGGVSRDVDGETVLTLRGLVYVDTGADFLEDINDLLRTERLDDIADRLREFDAEEVPLERIL